MADNRISFTFEINDKGKVKVDNITKGFVKMDAAIKKVSTSLNQQAAAARGSNAAMSNTVSNAGLAGATLTELGRTISDFNYGIRGMANNLSQLSMLFITLASKQERGGFAGFRLALSQLGKQLMGPLGIILAFQTLLTVLESFALSSEKAAKGTKSLIDEFKELTKIQLDRDQRIILQGQNVLNQLELEEQQLEKIKEIGESRIVGQDQYGRDIIRTIAFQNLSLEEQERIEKRLLKIQEIRFDTQAQIDAAIERQENKKKGAGGAGGKGDKLIPGTIAYYENEIKLLLAIQKLKVTTPEQFKAIEAEILKYEKLIEDLTGLKREVAESVLVTESPEKRSVLIAKKALEEGQQDRKKDLDDFIATEKKKVDAFYRAEKLKERGLRESNEIRLNAQTDLINGLAALGEKNKELMIAAIIAEKLVAINSIITDTQETNIALGTSGAKAGGILGFLGVKSMVAANNINSAISIAALTASAAGAIQGIRSGTDTNIGGISGGSTRGRATTTGGPTFNVVGASQFSQLAQAVEGRDEPIRAYVVASDVTNMQQLENNISNAASI